MQDKGLEVILCILKPHQADVPPGTAYHKGQCILLYRLFVTISIHELMVILITLYEMKTVLKIRWTNIRFLPVIRSYKIVRSITSQIGIWSRRLCSIWYGSISNTYFRDQTPIPKVGIVFSLSKKLSWRFGWTPYQMKDLRWTT